MKRMWIVGHVESCHTSQDSCQSKGGAGNNLQTLVEKYIFVEY